MRNKTLLTAFLLIIMVFSSQLLPAQLPKETDAQKTQCMKWWTDARFGMFIH